MRGITVNIDRHLAKMMAESMRKMHPDWSDEKIAACIAGLAISTPAQRMAWALEDRERQRAAQQASEARRLASEGQRPEPIAEDRKRDY
jgi:hypothetical protein